MLEVDGPADGGRECQTEETDLDGGNNEGLGDEGVYLFVEFQVKQNNIRWSIIFGLILRCERMKYLCLKV